MEWQNNILAPNSFSLNLTIIAFEAEMASKIPSPKKSLKIAFRGHTTT